RRVFTGQVPRGFAEAGGARRWRWLRAGRSLSLSAMDAARADTLAATSGLLPAGVAGDRDPGTSPRPRAGASARSRRAGDCSFQSHHAPRGHWTDFGGAAASLSSSPGGGRRRRNLAADAHTAARVVFRKALGLPAGLPAGHDAL